MSFRSGLHKFIAWITSEVSNLALRNSIHFPLFIASHGHSNHSTISDVRVTKNKETGDEAFIRKLHKGDFFGEKALTASSPTSSDPKIGENSSGALRTANVIAEDSTDHSGVSCLVIDREAFHQLISNRIQNFVPPSETTG